jgi:membrane protease subunit (stomatin/prohibitin family)
MSKLAGRDIKECQARLGEYSEDMKEELNRHFDSKGITIHSFIVSNLDFEPSHKVNREKLKEAKIGVKIKGVENEGRRDDISVDKAQSEIDIAMIRAEKGTDVYMNNNNAPANNNNAGNKSSGKKIFCSRCGEANDESVNYCFKCGEKLHK